MANDPDAPKIVIVCLESSRSSVSNVLGAKAPSWGVTREIRLVTIPDQWRKVKPEILNRVRAEAPDHDQYVAIMVLDKLVVSGLLNEEDDLRRLMSIPSHLGFEKKLDPVLNATGLDWLSYSERTLSQWSHGPIDKSHITGWLYQFEKLGSHKWVGESLLNAFQMWPENRVFSSIELTEATLADFQHVCFQLQQRGKSADVLTNLFAKRIKPLNGKLATLADFYEVLSGADNQSKIMFIEDGLFSGTEAIKLLSDLAGVPVPPGRNRKAPALASKALLQGREILMLFPVATDFGLDRLNRFLTENELQNIQASTTRSGGFNVLSSAGVTALREGKFLDPEFHNCPADPDNHLLPHAFADLAIWKTTERRERAIEFCKIVGGQVFQNYLQSQGWVWPPEKIRRCALGMYGLGLAFAFPHSVPKATLPLFWGGGKVEYDGKTLEWMPLFPNS